MKRKSIFSNLLFVYSLYLIVELVQSEDIIANTTNGRVRGTIRISTGSERPVYSFFGIPFARSPDYAFRFRPAIDPWKWEEVKDATDENIALCKQDQEKLRALRRNSIKQFFFPPDATFSEDCLTVNIFTPVKPSTSSQHLPVMVWIHGGSLQTSSTPHQLWMMSSFEDVVIVTVQYRLGPFGFLTLNDDSVKANLGLRDQVKALEWVRSNIHFFGGNRDLVTIYGQSSGGFSVSALSLSPYTRGLFHRVIAISGVAIKPSTWSSHSQNESALKMCKQLNCGFWKTDLIMTCMRNRVTSNQLINSTRSHHLLFSTTEDKDFFPESAKSLLHKHQFDKDIPLMLGGVTGEFDFIVARKNFKDYELGQKYTHKISKDLMLTEVSKYYSNVPRKKLEILVEKYLNFTNNKDTYERPLVDFFADLHFNIPMLETAEAYKNAGGKVFLYNFNHQPTFYLNPKLQNAIIRPYNFKRADHSDDVPFFLGLPFLRQLTDKGLSFTTAEERLSRKLMKHLATFAKTGEPTFEGNSWQQFPSYLFIDESKISMKENISESFNSKWWKLLANS